MIKLEEDNREARREWGKSDGWKEGNQVKTWDEEEEDEEEGVKSEKSKEEILMKSGRTEDGIWNVDERWK